MIAQVAFPATYHNHHIKTDDIHPRPLCPGYAIAVVTPTNDAFTAPDGRVIDKRRSADHTLSKEADGWKIVHWENVWVDAEAAKHDPVNSKKKERRPVAPPNHPLQQTGGDVALLGRIAHRGPAGC